MVRKYEKRPLESYLLTVLTGGYLGGFYKCSSGRGILNAPASKLSFAQGRQSTLRMPVQRDRINYARLQVKHMRGLQALKSGEL